MTINRSLVLNVFFSLMLVNCTFNISSNLVSYCIIKIFQNPPFKGISSLYFLPTFVLVVFYPHVIAIINQSIDAVYFNGMDKDGTCFVLRLGRRHNRRAEIWLSIRLSDGSFYQSPAHPDTVVYNTDGMTFSAAGLKMECVEPMRRWRVSYNGLLRFVICHRNLV